MYQSMGSRHICLRMPWALQVWQIRLLPTLRSSLNIVSNYFMQNWDHFWISAREIKWNTSPNCVHQNLHSFKQSINVKGYQFKRSIKGDQILRQTPQISNLLVLKLILHGAQRGTAVPPVTSSRDTIVVRTYWNAACARLLHMCTENAVVRLLWSVKKQKILSENQSRSRKFLL